MNRFILKLNFKLMILLCFILTKPGYAQQVANAEKISKPPIIFLPEADARKYISNYRDKKKRKTKTHSQSVFLNKNNFCFIQEFFNSAEGSKYDGVSIKMAIYKKILAEGQKDKKQITLYLTPTKKVGEKHAPDYNAFYNFRKHNPTAGKCDPSGIEITSINHGELCPDSCDRSTNPGLVNSLGIPTVMFNSIYILDSATAVRYKKYYKNRYCILNKFHTKSIWLDRENFLFIGDFFKDLPKNKDFDGIRIFFASYDKWMDEIPSQARRKQITIILTPTINKEPRFEAFNTYYPIYINKFTGGDKENRIKSLNHGELCPDKCPEN